MFDELFENGEPTQLSLGTLSMMDSTQLSLSIIR
jgi:hypothetical protein